MSSIPTVCPQCALEFSGGEVFCAIDGARLVPNTRWLDRSDGPSSDPLIGQTVASRYQILRKIGEGGMGIVYEAVHVVIEKHVALKVLREDFSHRADVVERFRQEAKSASRIGHEHIIDISDFGVTSSGANFFVMELLKGHDLAEELEKRGPLPTRRVVQIALQCAKALGAAHAKGIVHRDMKPENVFLVERDTGEDFVKIVDFGIAKMTDVETGAPGRKLTKTGMIFGTPEYMSPEQAAGKELDHRVDIYALGVIMYELLTGRVPFLGDTFMGILTQHMFEPVPPLSVANPQCSAPPELERIVYRAVSKSADQRHASMEELAGELVALLQRASFTSSSAPPPGTLTHVDREAIDSRPPGAQVSFRSAKLPSYDEPERPAKRPRVLLWSGLGLVATVAALALTWTLQGSPSRSHGALQAAGATAVAVDAPAQPPRPPALAPAEPAAPPERALAAVEVVTQPDGASVSVDGQKGCEPTPCRLEVPRGTAVRLAAQKSGYRSSHVELLPSRDLHQVELVLRKRTARGGNRMEGDLMLPDAFGK